MLIPDHDSVVVAQAHFRFNEFGILVGGKRFDERCDVVFQDQPERVKCRDGSVRSVSASAKVQVRGVSAKHYGYRDGNHGAQHGKK